MNQVTNYRADFPSAPLAVPATLAGEGDGRSRLSFLEQTWTAFLNHRSLAIGVVAGVFLLGLLATFLATPQYTSTTRLEILPDAPIATSVEGQRDKALINEISFYNTQYSLLQSESLADRVVRAGNLTADKDFLAAFGLENPDASKIGRA